MAIVCIGAIGGVSGGCSDSTAPSKRPERPPQSAGQLAQERRDESVDHAIGSMHAAALKHDRGAVSKAQDELERLARMGPVKTSSAHDPFRRMLDEFAFKRAPLFVLQVTSSRDDHLIYVGVDRAAFCLLTPDARKAAVRDVYRPADRRLRRAGVSDLEFVVVPVTQKAATYVSALAVGRRGSVRLTRRGQAC